MDEPKHCMSEQDGSVVYYKLPRPAWKKVPFVQPTKRQRVQEVEQLKAQLRVQSNRHSGRRERKVQIKQEARPIVQIKQEVDPLMDH